MKARPSNPVFFPRPKNKIEKGSFWVVLEVVPVRAGDSPSGAIYPIGVMIIWQFENRCGKPGGKRGKTR